MLDSRIYAGNQDIIMQRNRENFCLEVVNILNILISIGILVWYIWLSEYYSNFIYKIITGLELLYLGAWSYALCSLFARFKATKTLLPRKWVFIIHATLLTVCLVSQSIGIAMNKVLFGGNCDATCMDICWSINNIAVTISNACEVTTFAYVVYS